jgi:ubiquitin-activating enzyme E1 C
MTSDLNSKDRWAHVHKLIDRAGPFAGPGFAPDTVENPKYKNLLRGGYKVLVIGAGGLGCEILKGLAMSGFTNIEVIDMDTIDYSNLNRQFLFREDDVGKPKAVCAAAFINKRVPGANVVANFCRIEDKDEDYYRTFNLIIAGLDSVPARRWINSYLVNMVSVDDNGDPDPDTIIPLIDGATEGFKGQVRVIVPRITACYECAMETVPKQVTYPECTIAHTPRLPEHCVIYASTILWPRNFPDKKINNDDVADVTWVFEQAEARAKQFNIEGVTYRLTLGVIKNIIPAIAATNATIAAACVNEAFKICTDTSSYLDNYVQYSGLNGQYTFTFEYEKNVACPVCGSVPVTLELTPSMKLEELVLLLQERPRFQYKKPSLRCNNRNLFMQAPEFLRKATEPNLAKPLSELVADGDTVVVTDPVIVNTSASIVVKFVH